MGCPKTFGRDISERREFRQKSPDGRNNEPNYQVFCKSNVLLCGIRGRINGGWHKSEEYGQKSFEWKRSWKNTNESLSYASSNQIQIATAAQLHRQYVGCARLITTGTFCLHLSQAHNAFEI